MRGLRHAYARNRYEELAGWKFWPAVIATTDRRYRDQIEYFSILIMYLIYFR
jgi:hypothetical protein